MSKNGLFGNFLRNCLSKVPNFFRMVRGIKGVSFEYVFISGKNLVSGGRGILSAKNRGLEIFSETAH